MRFQNICFFLVVTTSLVSAAPAASVMLEEQAAVQPRVKRSLALQQTDFQCSAPGIYADQETGCEVFHFCQDDGRMDSFFCPNLTLFNQRFFVCDWSYNVDCNSAHQYYSLNDALYYSPETIQNAIQPAIKLAKQDEILSSQPSVVLSPQPPSLATSSSQLDAHIVVDNTLDRLSDQIELTREEIPQEDKAEEEKISETVRTSSVETPTLVSSSTYYDEVVDIVPDTPSPYYDELADSVSDTPSASYDEVADSVPYSPTQYYDEVADPEPDYVLSPLPTYSSDSLNIQDKSYSYDDADPEPADYYGSDPEPESYPPSYYSPATPVLSASQPLYLDDVADPEPAGYDPYGFSDNNYQVYQGQGLVYDPLSDPEPSSDPEFSPYES